MYPRTQMHGVDQINDVISNTMGRWTHQYQRTAHWRWWRRRQIWPGAHACPLPSSSFLLSRPLLRPTPIRNSTLPCSSSISASPPRHWRARRRTSQQRRASEEDWTAERMKTALLHSTLLSHPNPPATRVMLTTLSVAVWLFFIFYYVDLTSILF